MRSGRGWTMPTEEAAAMVRLIDERIGSPLIDTRHRDALIRLRAMLEDDLSQQSGANPVPSQNALGDGDRDAA